MTSIVTLPDAATVPLFGEAENMELEDEIEYVRFEVPVFRIENVMILECPSTTLPKAREDKDRSMVGEGSGHSAFIVPPSLILTVVAVASAMT